MTGKLIELLGGYNSVLVDKSRLGELALLQFDWENNLLNFLERETVARLILVASYEMDLDMLVDAVGALDSLMNIREQDRAEMVLH